MALRALVEEIAPRIEGRRVAGVSSPARDCLELVVGDGSPLVLGVVALRALPLMFVSGDGFPPCGGAPGDAPGRLGELEGATVVSLEALPGSTVAVLRVERTHRAGRAIERALVFDCGRRPGFALRDAGFVPRPAGEAPCDRTGEPGLAGASRGGVRDGEAAGHAPVLAWRRDETGRLHVGFPPSDRPWEDRARFETWNDAALHAARVLLPELVTERRRTSLARAIRRTAGRKRRALEKVRRELAESMRAEEHRHKAQLLLTRKNDVKRGRSPVTVLDYDNATEVEIDVDPLLPPARNAEILFGRARKAERKALRTPERMREIEAELEKLEADLARVAGASPEVMSRLEEKVRPPRPAPAGGTRGERARFRTYEVTGGWKVLVGKSNRDNDALTHRIAGPDDLWFHVRQSPGSHVVLRKAGRSGDPGPEAIREAAAIAAYHSKAGGSKTVPVCYTERRHVRKPRGAKAGLAVVRNEKVIYVDPGLPKRDRPARDGD
ncbi:MAG: NFACT RNA binding domain-containing protein [Candidatus Eisenbacteria bacterium]